MVDAASLSPAVRLCVVAAGVFFLAGLLTGVWKYRQMSTRDAALAHPYVDICHRAALMYSFAALLLAVFAALSAWSATVTLWAAALPLAFFAQAILIYALHGALGDTDNQLRAPHRLGSRTLPPALIHAGMWLLIAAELGGFLVLLAGALVGMGLSV